MEFAFLVDLVVGTDTVAKEHKIVEAMILTVWNQQMSSARE